MCRRCAKTKVECGGYSRPLTIVIENTRVVRGAKGGTHQNGRRPPLEDLPRTISVLLMKRQACERKPPEPLLIAPSQLTDELYMVFLVNKLAICDGATKADDTWSLMHATNSRTSMLSYTALSAAFFGKSHALPDVTLKGASHYGRALQSLAEDLNSQPLSIITLASMTALAMYELVAFTTVNAWIDHGRGVAKCLQRLGPRSFRWRPARAILMQNRMMLVSRAIMDREPTFLSDDEWKTVPWEEEPECKTDRDYLIDILSDLAGILAGVDALGKFKRDVVRIHIELAALVDRLVRCFVALNAWWQKWYPANRANCWRVPIDQATTVCFDQGGALVEARMEFDSFWTCYTLMSYHAAKILVLETHRQLADAYGLGRLPADGVANLHGEELAGASGNTKVLLKELMECLDYCDQQARSFASTFCIMFPLFVAANYYQDESREESWMCKACKIEEHHLVGYVTVAGRVSVSRLELGKDAHVGASV